MFETVQLVENSRSVLAVWKTAERRLVSGLVHRPVIQTQHNTTPTFHTTEPFVSLGVRVGMHLSCPTKIPQITKSSAGPNTAVAPPHPYTRTAKHPVSEIFCWCWNKTGWTKSRYQTSLRGTCYHQNRTKLCPRTYVQTDGQIQGKELYALLATFHS
jgi:hypothetical protein